MNSCIKNNSPRSFEPKSSVIVLTSLLFTFFLVRFFTYYYALFFVSLRIFSQDHSFTPHFHVFSLNFLSSLKFSPSSYFFFFFFFFPAYPLVIKKGKTEFFPFFHLFMKLPLVSIQGIFFILFDYCQSYTSFLNSDYSEIVIQGRKKCQKGARESSI